MDYPEDDTSRTRAELMVEVHKLDGIGVRPGAAEDVRALREHLRKNYEGRELDKLAAFLVYWADELADLLGPFKRK